MESFCINDDLQVRASDAIRAMDVDQHNQMQALTLWPPFDIVQQGLFRLALERGQPCNLPLLYIQALQVTQTHARLTRTLKPLKDISAQPQRQTGVKSPTSGKANPFETQIDDIARDLGQTAWRALPHSMRGYLTAATAVLLALDACFATEANHAPKLDRVSRKKNKNGTSRMVVLEQEAHPVCASARPPPPSALRDAFSSPRAEPVHVS